MHPGIPIREHCLVLDLLILGVHRGCSESLEDGICTFMWLVVSNIFFLHNIWEVILSIDELIFFKIGKTTNQIMWLGKSMRSSLAPHFVGNRDATMTPFIDPSVHRKYFMQLGWSWWQQISLKYGLKYGSNYEAIDLTTTYKMRCREQ